MRASEVESDRLVATVRDSSRDLQDRIDAAEMLRSRVNSTVVSALVGLAQDERIPHELATAVGRSLGAVCFQRAEDIDELDMAIMTDAADLAYDQEIGRLQRIDPSVTMRRAGHTGA